jgi:hypothetical protein
LNQACPLEQPEYNFFVIEEQKLPAFLFKSCW